MLPVRVRRVDGVKGRSNDVLFQPASVRPGPPGRNLTSREQQTLVFFGGDVQDYPEVMEAHRDNRNFQHWNLERTARILGQSFPTKHILVVKPSRVVNYHCFSVQDSKLYTRKMPYHHEFHHDLPSPEAEACRRHDTRPLLLRTRAMVLTRLSSLQKSLRNSLTQSAENTCYNCHKSHRIEFKSFSCYDNFVPSNEAGVPEHTPTHNALNHLERLLQGVSSRLKLLPISELLEAVTSKSLPEDIDIEELHNATIQPAAVAGTSEANGANGAKSGESQPEDNPLWWRNNLSLDETQLSLVGFSKGCVVLNQLIYEFHYTKTLTPGDLHTMRFISRISAMYWLDGGHAGGKNTWLTARSLLETLARLGLNIYIHVSPYQVHDEARPWIGREEKTFTALLKKLGAKVRRYMHDGGAPYSLHTHFDVIANFQRVQDAAPAPARPADE